MMGDRTFREISMKQLYPMPGLQFGRLMAGGILGILLLGMNVAPISANSAIAQTRRGDTPATPNLNRPVLQAGSRGTEVSELQATLQLLGYYTGPIDGIYSEETAEAVSAFQEAAGLSPDGVVGRSTWERLFPPESTVVAEPEPEVCVCPETTRAATLVADSTDSREASFPVLKLGMRGEAVAGLQERLRAKGFLDGEADGIFGPETQAAVKGAQREYEITPDGVVGATTWRVLLR
ncbi:MAG: peptidoglycan-binding domain-containing protein [Limnospira sp.]